MSFFPVTEQSEDTGLVYPLSVVVVGRELQVLYERLLLFEEQGMVAKKLIWQF